MNHSSIARKITAALFAAHSLGSAALIVTATVNTIAGAELSGNPAWAGVPAAVLQLGAALAPLSTDLIPLSFALFLLGLGWNLTYVAGSALLSDILSPAERATTQGTNDFLIGVATALASIGSGIVFAEAGYVFTGIIGAMVALIPLGLTGWWMAGRQGLATA